MQKEQLELLKQEHFRIIKDKHTGQWIVARVGFPKEFHSHFDSLDGCNTLMNLFFYKICPNDPYFRTAMQRITTPEEFEKFKTQKEPQKFYKKPKHQLKRKGG